MGKVIAVAESYDLQIRLMSGDLPFAGQAAVLVRNTGKKELEALTFYLHPELGLKTITNSAGENILFNTEVVLYPFSYTFTAKAITLLLPQKLDPGKTTAITFQYQGWFHPSRARSISDYMKIDQDGAYLRSFGYSLWFPVLAKGEEDINASAHFRLVLDIPDKWKPLAFGTRLSEIEENGRNRSLWETAKPFTLLFCQLSAASWEVSGDEEFFVYHFASPESREAAKLYARTGKVLIDFFTKNYGGSLQKNTFFLGQMCRYGAISSGNVIGLPSESFEKVLSQDGYYPMLEYMAHELVHGYVIPAIDPQALGAAILIETFPSYFHLPALKQLLGEDFESWFLRWKWQQYENGKRSQGEKDIGNIPKEKPLSEIAFSEVGTYKDIFLLGDKGVIVLDRLQRELGANVFFRSVSQFFRNYRNVPATLQDFIEILEKESHFSLTMFKQQWFDSIAPLPKEWIG